MNYIQPDPEIQGWMGAQELQWLYERASEMDSIVEVGSWKGRSTHALLSGCKGTVVAVDHFLGSASERDGAHALAKTQDIFKAFWKNVGHFSNLIVLKRNSPEAASLFGDNKVDMIFVDGDHAEQAFLADVTGWLPKCRKLFCGNDTYQDGVPKVLGRFKFQFHEVGCIWYIDKDLIEIQKQKLKGAT